MSGLLYLIPIALFLGLVGLAAFLWAVRSGQFDDSSTAPPNGSCSTRTTTAGSRTGGRPRAVPSGRSLPTGQRDRQAGRRAGDVPRDGEEQVGGRDADQHRE